MNQKIKIMNQKPELSDAEIRSYMDFDGLLKKKASKRIAKRVWIFATTVVITSAAIVYLVRFSTPPDSLLPIHTSPAPNIISPQPERSTSQQEKERGEAITEQEAPREQKKMPLQKPATVASPLPAPPAPPAAGPTGMYIQAEPLCGYTALYEYFSTSLVYPPEAVKDSINGVLTVSFIINTQGRSEKIEVKESLGAPFEREAKRLIENMPLWKPAEINGKKISSRMSLPLTFQVK